MLVAPRISECFDLSWSALVCYSLLTSSFAPFGRSGWYVCLHHLASPVFSFSFGCLYFSLVICFFVVIICLFVCLVGWFVCLVCLFSLFVCLFVFFVFSAFFRIANFLAKKYARKSQKSLIRGFWLPSGAEKK